MDTSHAKAITASDAALNKPSGTKRAQHKVTAYYFHRTVRCDTCCAIETLAAPVRAEFAGALEWRVINMENAGNEPFVKDYNLTASTLVLVDLTNGRQVRWAKLNRAWDLVHNPLDLA